MSADFRVFHDLDEVNGFGPSVLTIGNFDGVHIGHRRIFRRVAQIAAENGWQPSVLTFSPHPTKVVAPDRSPLLLTTLDQRCELMRQAGIRQVLVLSFTPEIAKLTPDEFVVQILVEKLGARAILVGENFRFGYRAAGGIRLLAELGKRYGFVTEIVSAVAWRRSMISSSVIRRLIRDGAVDRTARFLERPYSLDGDVIPGHGVGSKQTVPTLNLSTPAEVLPALGVYVTRTRDLDDGRSWPSVTNIGYRPTFGGDSLSIETFLLKPLDGSAPRHIRVELLRRLREERKFESPEALKAQILRDAARAQAYFRRLDRWVHRSPAEPQP